MNTPPFEFATSNHPLAPLTLYQVGGPAAWALTPRTLDEARAAYQWMRRQSAPQLVLGGGSNVLIADGGFPGIVLITTGLQGAEDLGGGRSRVEAGVDLGWMVRDVMLPNNYAGVGGLTGIPGSVGGAIYMNAGTNKGTICQLMESVEVASPSGVQTVAMDPSLYGYRGQTFCPPGSLILQGHFRFEPAGEDQRAIYERYIERRAQTQPKGPSCGSVFKNPEGDHAGRLIEACGLKGTRRGGAVISPKHANFILNENGASSADILWLMDLCKRRVREQFGVALREEVSIIPPRRAERVEEN